MSVPGAAVIIDEVVSAGVPLQYNLLFIPDRIDAINNTTLVRFSWFLGMASGSAYQTSAAGVTTLIATGGFTPFDDSLSFNPIADTAITAITAANPASVTMSAPHGLVTGDVVRLVNVPGMQAICGMDFVVTVTGAATFTIPVSTVGFVAVPVAGSVVRKVIGGSLFVPKDRVITAITQANPGVVTTATNHGFQIGEIVRINTFGWGMSQLEGQLVTVTPVTANTFSIGVDTSAMSAFLFPDPAFVPPFTQPQATPVGDNNQTLSGATDNVGAKGVVLGSAIVNASGNHIFVTAYKADA